MQLKDLSKRVSQLLEQSTGVLGTKKYNQYGFDYVDSGALSGLRASVFVVA